jgi:zinc/manganese transport system substrate-binding protein
VVRVRAVAALGLLAVLLLGACGIGAGSGPAVASGDPARCPGRVLDVVVSVAQWGAVVRPLAGPCATVTTVLSSPAADPHEYEPTTGDIAALQEADLVVLNGAGYDEWAAKALTDLEPGPALVNAAALAGRGATSNPHLWYQPDLVPRVADAVTDRMRTLSRADAPVFERQAADFHAALQTYLDAVTRTRVLARGHTYAATETVFDRTAHALGLTDLTPAGYRRSVSNGSDPAPGDVAALEAALAGRRVDVLVVNTQTEGSLPAQLRATARRAGVPVVDVTESPPQAGGSFVAWQLAQLTELTDALGRVR